MNKIEIYHTCIVVNNYTFGDCRKLENYFSIFDRVTYTVRYIGIYYDEVNHKLYLPRGVDIYFVEKLIGQKAILMTDCDPYDKINIRLKYAPRDDIQKQALRFMVGEGEYVKNRAKSQLSVNLNTGAGKTYVSIASIAYLGLKSIVITSQSGWLDQWADRIAEYTDIKPKEIFLISGSSSIRRLYSKKDLSQYKIFLCNDRTLVSYASTVGWEAVGDLFKYLKIGLKVFDEAHLHFDAMSMIDFFTNTRLTYYVTATPARSNDDENRIYSYYFKNVPSIDLFDENVDPRTKYLAISFNSRPSPYDISRCKNAYGLDRNKYIDYLVDRPNFDHLMHIIMDICIKTKGKVLIYIGTNNAILKIRDWIYENYPHWGDSVGIYTSITPEEIKKSQLDKKIILSTTKSCGAASDIKGLKKTIVLAEPFKSEVIARQTLGRTRDRDTLYIDIVDEGFSQLRKFYKHKIPVFNKYATECGHMYISDTELESKAEEIKAYNEQLIRPVEFIKSPIYDNINKEK